jgi:hypothetical protein
LNNFGNTGLNRHRPWVSIPVRQDRIPVYQAALDENGSIPVVQSPQDIHIYVAGGSPGYTLLFGYLDDSHVSRKIHGATLTEYGR